MAKLLEGDDLHAFAVSQGLTREQLNEYASLVGGSELLRKDLREYVSTSGLMPNRVIEPAWLRADVARIRHELGAPHADEIHKRVIAHVLMCLGRVEGEVVDDDHEELAKLMRARRKKKEGDSDA